MDLLLDENVPYELLHTLRAQGHAASHIAELGPASADVDVLALAIEARSVLVTFDSDFSELIYRHGHPAPSAIFYLQGSVTDFAELADQLRLVIATGLFNGQMIVIRRDSIRYGPFPG
jgi:predicted nuclease of predicted toxin-antitoxin system